MPVNVYLCYLFNPYKRHYMHLHKDDFLRLLSKKVSQELSPQEQIDFAIYLHQHPEQQAVVDQLMAFMAHKQSPQVDTQQQANLEQVWARLGEKPTPIPTAKVKSIFRTKWSVLIAAASIILVLSWYLNRPSLQEANSSTLAYEEVQSGNNKLFVSLADGTAITLNKSASLSYNTDFGQQQRQIRLAGSAFFDVSKNESIPLHIAFKNLEVVVKGTSFYIEQDSLQEKTRLSLFQGVVEIASKDGLEEPLRIQPNQVVEWTANEKSPRMLQVQEISLFEKESWKNQTQDSIVFKKQKFVDLAKKLTEVYQVSVIFENKALAQKRFSGVLYRMELRVFLENLRATYSFDYQINDTTLIIR